MHCSVSADTIDDALNVSAGVQLSCFRMREKFDLVVMYDNNSTSFDRGSPLYVLYEAIYTTYTGPKTLKRPPMMLVGGIEAWRKDFGAAELDSGSSPSEALASTSLTPSASTPISKTPSSNGIASPPLPSSSSNPPAFDSRTLYRSRADTHSGTSPSISGSIPPTIQEHRSHYSLDQSAGHMRCVNSSHWSTKYLRMFQLTRGIFYERNGFPDAIGTTTRNKAVYFDDW